MPDKLGDKIPLKYPTLTKLGGNLTPNLPGMSLRCKTLTEIADDALILELTVAEDDRQSKIIFQENICRDQPCFKEQVI